LAYRLLYILPKNLLSHFVGKIAHSTMPLGLHRLLRDWFIKHFKVDVAESELSLDQYPTLGDFFKRHLKPGSRPVDTADLVSPVDGTLTQGGRFQNQSPRLTQIKGMEYRLHDLVGPGWNLEDYLAGGFLTIYLAPYNYHRIHSPLAGQVTQVAYIPGALWPVNTWSVNHIPGLFVVNERLIVEVAGAAGKALVVMVGATNVGRITLDFHAGLVGNEWPRSRERLWKPPQTLPIAKGHGLGCFELGSTVVVILSNKLIDQVDPALLSPGSRLMRMGQRLTP
jgi:phosphatidylserine decarboxylase